ALVDQVDLIAFVHHDAARLVEGRHVGRAAVTAEAVQVAGDDLDDLGLRIHHADLVVVPGGEHERAVGQELDVGRVVERDRVAGRALGGTLRQAVLLLRRAVPLEHGADDVADGPVRGDDADHVVVPVEHPGAAVGPERDVRRRVEPGLVAGDLDPLGVVPALAVHSDPGTGRPGRRRAVRHVDLFATRTGEDQGRAGNTTAPPRCVRHGDTSGMSLPLVMSTPSRKGVSPTSPPTAMMPPSSVIHTPCRSSWVTSVRVAAQAPSSPRSTTIPDSQTASATSSVAATPRGRGTLVGGERSVQVAPSCSKMSGWPSTPPTAMARSAGAATENSGASTSTSARSSSLPFQWRAAPFPPTIQTSSGERPATLRRPASAAMSSGTVASVQVDPSKRQAKPPPPLKRPPTAHRSLALAPQMPKTIPL